MPSSGFAWGDRMGNQVQWEEQLRMEEGGSGGEHRVWVRNSSQLLASGSRGKVGMKRHASYGS